MASLIFLLFGLGVIALGGWVMRRAFTVRKRANLVEETPTEDVESVSMGQSEIEGTATPADEGTITAPFTDEECLVAAWEVEEFVVIEDNDGSDTRRWNTEGIGLDAVPFYVDDGTGRALVRPSTEATYDLDTGAEEPIVVPDGTEPPDRVATFLERDGWEGVDVGAQSWTNSGGTGGDWDEGDRRFSQHLIRPDEDVYVFGVAQPREDVRGADNAENVVFEKVPEEDEDLEDMFMISDLEEEELTQRTGDAMKWYAFGIGLAMFGFLLVLVGIGAFG